MPLISSERSASEGRSAKAMPHFSVRLSHRWPEATVICTRACAAEWVLTAEMGAQTGALRPARRTWGRSNNCSKSRVRWKERGATAIHRKRACVSADADVHNALVASDVIDQYGTAFPAVRSSGKSWQRTSNRVTGPPPFCAAIREATDRHPFLRINRDQRLTAFSHSLRSSADFAKLLIPIGMLRAFETPVSRLKASPRPCIGSATWPVDSVAYRIQFVGVLGRLVVDGSAIAEIASLRRLPKCLRLWSNLGQFPSVACGPSPSCRIRCSRAAHSARRLLDLHEGLHHRLDTLTEVYPEYSWLRDRRLRCSSRRAIE